jgi:hypothetical protein
MIQWRFLAFQYFEESRPLDDWQRALGIESFNKFSAILEHLQVLPRNFWVRPQFDVLHGPQYRGMGEIRFKGDGKVHRVFGWFGPERLQFTLLHGCVKQRRDLTAEMEIARERRDLVISHGWTVLYEFTFMGNVGTQAEEQEIQG